MKALEDLIENGSGVKKAKASAELAQLKAEDPLPLRKAKVIFISILILYLLDFFFFFFLCLNFFLFRSPPTLLFVRLSNKWLPLKN